MATDPNHLGARSSVRLRWSLALLAALMGLAGAASAAEPASGTQGRQRPASNRCPLIVKPVDAVFQPMTIPPEQVAAKNRAGCLSPGDAVYGPDGCPIRFCREDGGVIPLPPGGPR